MPEIIILKQTAAADNYKYFRSEEVPMTFQLDKPLAGAETILFYLIGESRDVADDMPWVDEDGVQYSFTATKTTPIPVYSPIDVRAVKTLTATLVGLNLIGR